MSPNDAAAFIALLVVSGILLRPLVRAWARRLEGNAGGADLRQELEELRERVAELEGAHAELQELGERVEFAERMLAQRIEPGQLPDVRTPV